MLPVSEAASLERLPTQVWHLNDPQRATSAERRHPPKGAASKTAHEISTALRGGGGDRGESQLQHTSAAISALLIRTCSIQR